MLCESVILHEDTSCGGERSWGVPAKKRPHEPFSFAAPTIPHGPRSTPASPLPAVKLLLRFVVAASRKGRRL
jgi:hypothetical protein